MLNCQLFRNFAGRSGVIHGKGGCVVEWNLNKLSKMAYLTAEKKQELFGQYGKSNTDTVRPRARSRVFVP